MTKARCITGIAFALFLFSFSVAAKKPKAAVADFFPLRAWDSWTYRNTGDDSRYSLKILNEEKQGDGSSRYEMELLAGVQVRKFFSKPSGWVLLHVERYPSMKAWRQNTSPPNSISRIRLSPDSNGIGKGKTTPTQR